MKLEWKDTGPDGWSRKPYQIARRGKLSFRLSPRTRATVRATIAVSHDEIHHERDMCQTTSPIVYETRTATSAARDYAESFDYQEWRHQQISTAEEAVEGVKKDLARCEERLRAAERLPLNA